MKFQSNLAIIFDVPLKYLLFYNTWTKNNIVVLINSKNQTIIINFILSTKIKQLLLISFLVPK